MNQVSFEAHRAALGTPIPLRWLRSEVLVVRWRAVAAQGHRHHDRQPHRHVQLHLGQSSDERVGQTHPPANRLLTGSTALRLS